MHLGETKEGCGERFGHFAFSYGAANKFSCRILAFKFSPFSSFSGLPKEYTFRVFKTLHFYETLFLLLKNLPEVVTAGKLNISVPG